jgi:serine/threonine protein kinase
MLVLKLVQQKCPELIPVTPTFKLGDGADGEVFEIEGEPNKVIKFCFVVQKDDSDLYQTYLDVSKLLTSLSTNPLPTYAHVYEHRYLGEYTRIVWGNLSEQYLLYYYIMEKLFKLSEDEKKVFHTIACHEDQQKKKNFSLGKVKEMLRDMSAALDFDAEKVTFFCDNLRKAPVKHLDIHVRNIMKDTSGNFKLIDFDRAEMKYGKR